MALTALSHIERQGNPRSRPDWAAAASRCRSLLEGVTLVAQVVPQTVDGVDVGTCSEREPPGRNVLRGESPSSMSLQTDWVLLSTRQLL
jgi:hypothetical protein